MYLYGPKMKYETNNFTREEKATIEQAISRVFDSSPSTAAVTASVSRDDYYRCFLEINSPGWRFQINVRGEDIDTLIERISKKADLHLRSWRTNRFREQARFSGEPIRQQA